METIVRRGEEGEHMVHYGEKITREIVVAFRCV